MQESARLNLLEASFETQKCSTHAVQRVAVVKFGVNNTEVAIVLAVFESR